LGHTVAASLQAPELFQIAQDLHQMKVEASVDEADIGRISDGLQVRFSVDAYQDRQFSGRVEQIRKAPDKIQNVVTYRVIIAAANSDLALLPGMTANVEVVLGRKENVLKIPNAALRFTPRSAPLSIGGMTRESASSSGSHAGGGRGSGPNPGALIARLNETMDLTPEQTGKLEALMEEMRSRFEARANRSRGSTGAGVDHQAMRDAFQRVRDNMNASIKAILNAEQRSQFEDMQATGRARAKGARPATIWVLEEGQPVSRTVMVGLADDDATEIVRGLSEGDSVIVRATRVSG
ncbi:MAG: HlyD family efflux transporter periplasmic adaptor subunit, partial [Pseudomonadales bacterium]